MPPPAPEPLPVGDLRRRCAPETLPFADTGELQPVERMVGQDEAWDALEFGLSVQAPGHNVFVRGAGGTGRLTLVKQVLKKVAVSCPLAHDHCLVHNFDRPEQPRLITLPRGQGKGLRRRMGEFVNFLQEELDNFLGAEAVRRRQAVLEESLVRELRDAGKPFEDALQQQGLALVHTQTPQGPRPAIVPLVDGKPVAPEEFARLRQEGEITDDKAEQVMAQIRESGREYQKLSQELAAIQGRHRDALRELLQEQLTNFVSPQLEGVRAAFAKGDAAESVGEFVDQVAQDLLARLDGGNRDFGIYQVNLLHEHDERGGCPTVFEGQPTTLNLVGGVDPFSSGDDDLPVHMRFKAGSLLRADGGFLILDARDLLMEQGGWRALARTLRTGQLEITGLQLAGPSGMALPVKAEPIPLNVKVVLVGDGRLHALLDHHDPDFPELFKVLADVDAQLPWSDDAMDVYGRFIKRLVQDHTLPDFTADAVASLVEYGSRIAGRRDRITARFGRLQDLVFEAAWVARQRNATLVTAEHVSEAVVRGRTRADRPARRFRESILDGTLGIVTTGHAVGQVNGLAVMSAGPFTYGFPARITATVGAGRTGMVDVEAQSSLSGSIHTKGFHILEGLLRHLLHTEHPLNFRGSLAFEQSYGGIDGDSASGAEICALLSALSEIPLRQDLAMTGAIDQKGALQAIGGVNEKIEGFFDVCNLLGLSGTQGVIIPASNQRNLMLRQDVLEAVEAGKFRVWAVETVLEALEILTGQPAGLPGSAGEATVLGRAMIRAHRFWHALGNRDL